jgi:hypothetical protein
MSKLLTIHRSRGEVEGGNLRPDIDKHNPFQGIVKILTQDSFFMILS